MHPFLQPDGARVTPNPMDTITPEHIRSLAHASVLVIGDVMLDRYTYGAVNRISVEAPVPILSIEREVEQPGGAGNVVRNLTALGAAAALISVVGDDAAGSELTGLIGGQPGVEPWLLVQGSRTTTLKTRFIASGQQLLRTDREQTDPIHPKLAERLVRIASDAMAATSVTVLSDYGKGVLAGDVPAALVANAKKMNRPVIVDPRGADFARYAGADIVMPNRPELAEATGLPVNNEAAIVAAATALRARFRFGAVIVTRANDGMTLVDDDGAKHFPAEASVVHDTSGAGDTALATLATAIAMKVPLATAVRLANLAAGISVGKVGNAVVRDADLLHALSPQASVLRKIVDRAEATELAERWRRRGWRVGFVNGCFDRLHPGHVHLLERARASCDRLIVGANADASVARLKGAALPVQPEAARAAILAGLGCVDLVCVFDEDTPEPLIEALRPDVLAKGADRTLEEVVGADLLRAWGGKVVLVDLLPGHPNAEAPSR